MHVPFCYKNFKESCANFVAHMEFIFTYITVGGYQQPTRDFCAIFYMVYFWLKLCIGISTLSKELVL